MLMAISLVEKLGPNHKLLAFSLHPGVIWTNLSNHLNWSVAFDGLRKLLGNGVFNVTAANYTHRGC